MKVNSRRPRLLTVHVALGRVRVGADRAGQGGGMKTSAASTSGNLSNIAATGGTGGGVNDDAEGRAECDESVDNDETNQSLLVSDDAAPPTPPTASTPAAASAVADTQSVSKSAPLPNSPSAIAKAAMTLIKKIIQEYITRTGTSSFSSAAVMNSSSNGSSNSSGSGFDAGIECITYLSLTGTSFEDVADGSEAISSYFARAASKETEPTADRSASTSRAGAVSYGAREQQLGIENAVTSLQAPSSSPSSSSKRSNQLTISKPTIAVPSKQQQKGNISSGLLTQFLQPMSPSQLSQQPTPLSRYQQAKPPIFNKGGDISRYYNNSSSSRCDASITDITSMNLALNNNSVIDKQQEQPCAITSYDTLCDISDDDDDVIVLDTLPTSLPSTNTHTSTVISKLDSASSLVSYTITSSAPSHKRPASLITNTHTTATTTATINTALTTATLDGKKEVILTRAGVDLGVFLSLPPSLQAEVLSQATASNVRGNIPVETKRSKKSSIASFFKK